MDPFDYAQLEDALDYLYDFLDQDLADRVRAEREFVPAGLEGLLADDSLDDYVWLWIRTQARMASGNTCAMGAIPRPRSLGLSSGRAPSGDEYAAARRVAEGGWLRAAGHRLGVAASASAVARPYTKSRLRAVKQEPGFLAEDVVSEFMTYLTVCG